jgi:hypothetical protein
LASMSAGIAGPWGRGASPSGLGWARRARSGPEVRGAERRGRRRSLPPCLSWTTYAFLHLFASPDNSEIQLSNCGEYRITPHAIVGGDSNVCSAVSYFSTRVG